MAATDDETPHITAIRRSVDAGFRFLHLSDADGREVIAIHAECFRGGVVDTYTVRAMNEAVGARFRADDYPDGDPLWQHHGPVVDVVTALMALPPPGVRGAPSQTLRRSSGL
ncbi:hypothetical protein EIL87_12260 [Saccharopolyspora rhizosphaerae]|uniref:Uncharacterized protein n=1 Tax=Saccharopolyspora rhizosphaerae TaxID=2492662 RepID=A0A426JVD8_9PSEU|nr:hypothetical protein [Saccharopolyspora rhizosphaerae]RRO17041.1 hypothetical protein EIL87_12260 [Saccharopolyspora rhizosphaerae]